MEERSERRGGPRGAAPRGRFARNPRYGTPKKRQAKPVRKREKHVFNFKLFNRWDSNVPVNDPSLKSYINLEAKILPRSAGTHRGRFHKSKMHITERLALKLSVSGHTGKKHKLTSGKFGGNYNNVIKIVEHALAIIEKKENKNPIEVLVKAIENAALREEVISYQLGSIMARESVITAPQRRVDKTLRFFAQSAYRKSFNKKKSLADSLAEEIMAAFKNSQDSFAVKEKERIEREAGGAR
ncbi:MAG: 30S ribosomal protein S7 [Candidatus Aenigmarchaeota archaeon]|nr:30S ribosomal protein S7 [Candidatus Aenigmarchaeota archaeon]